MKTFELQPFSESDIELLNPVMKRAFDADSRLHLGHDSGPPGYDDGSFLRQWALHPESTALRIDIEGKPSGTAILWINRYTNINRLGCLFIDSDYQHSGVGTEIWKKIETMFPDTREWRTETPGFSRLNHHFYVNKCGFEIYKIENPLSPEEASYKLRKQMRKNIEVYLEDKAEFNVVALTREFNSDTCMDEIPKFWTTFHEQEYDKVICGMFGICHSCSPDGKFFKYSIAGPAESGTELPDGFETLTIPAHTWAVFSCVGAMPHAIQNMWNHVYSQWLPESGYEKIFGYDIEFYTKGNLQSPDYESFIWIPVRKK
jgi:predicted transcriptional regulator YdeE